MIFVFEDMGVQSVVASIIPIMSISCQTHFHVYSFSFFILNPGNSIDCLKNSIDQEDRLVSLQKFYHKRKGQDGHYEKLYISVTSVVSATF